MALGGIGAGGANDFPTTLGDGFLDRVEDGRVLIHHKNLDRVGDSSGFLVRYGGGWGGGWGRGPVTRAAMAAKTKGKGKAATPAEEFKGTFRLTALAVSAGAVPGDQIDLHQLRALAGVTASSWDPAHPPAGCLDPRNDAGWSPDLAATGPVHLTGPHGGAPYGLAVVIRALAGPYDLGTVVVRAGIRIDPVDAHLTIDTDALRICRIGVTTLVATRLRLFSSCELSSAVLLPR